MKLTQFKTVSSPARALLALTVTCILLACGGGGSGTTPYTGTGFNLRPLPAEFTARQAVNYSPYRTNNRDTETPAAANILQDLNLLISGNIKLIRLFDSSEKSAKAILDVIQNNSLDMKVQLGIWITAIPAIDPRLTPAQNKKAIDDANKLNDDEIKRGVDYTNTYCPSKNTADANCIVLAVSIGNEKMVNWGSNMDPKVMAAYISRVRSQVVQPLTSDDDWAFWAEANGNTASPVPVLDVIDFVSAHTYPMSESVYNQWDWRQASTAEASRAQAMMDAALARAKADYAAVRNNINRHGRIDLPITIGETGWRAENTYNPDVTYRASRVNQMMYYNSMSAWRYASRSGTGPANIFSFEAFDEPWKGGDDKWGLFNVSRQARCAVQSLSASYTKETGSCATTDAVYWKALTASKITAGKYTLYADKITAAESRPAAVYWNGWDSWKTVSVPNPDQTDGALADNPNFKQITPTPESWGWGLALMLNDPSNTATVAADLSGMGYLNFSIKTDYPGQIEIGFVTGSGNDSSSYEVYMLLSSGQHGYANDGAWHSVKVPLSDIITAATAVAGQPDNHGNRVDLTNVTQPFVIADRYAKTGNSSSITNKINIDNIYWSSN